MLRGFSQECTMAQYQEWLHYHEVDRHLQAQLAELVNELAQLQEQAHVYEQDIYPPSAETAIRETIPLPHDNVILHALAVHMNGDISSNGYSAQESFTAPNSHSEIIPSEPESLFLSPSLLRETSQILKHQLYLLRYPILTLRNIPRTSINHFLPMTQWHCCPKIWSLFSTSIPPPIHR